MEYLEVSQMIHECISGHLHTIIEWGCLIWVEQIVTTKKHGKHKEMQCSRHMPNLSRKTPVSLKILAKTHQRIVTKLYNLLLTGWIPSLTWSLLLYMNSYSPWILRESKEYINFGLPISCFRQYLNLYQPHPASHSPKLITEITCCFPSTLQCPSSSSTMFSQKFQLSFLDFKCKFPSPYFL